MENLDFVLSLFNQFVFQDAKNNMEALEYYINVNPATCGNTLISNLLGAIKTYPFEAIDEPLFRSILSREKKTAAEQAQIFNDLIRWKNYGKAQMEPTKKYLGDIIASSILSRANTLYGNDPMEYIKYLKQANICLDKSDLFTTQNFNDIDINTLVAESSGQGFKSHFDWINNLFEPGNCYEMGQLGMISMPPGVGKSLFMMTEAASIALSYPEAKVLYLAMGDLKMKDFVIRMGSIVSGMPFAETTRNLGNTYANLKTMFQDRLHISINPAGSVDPDEFVEYVLANKFNVVFCDYDSNFKLSRSDNMYNDFGQVYNGLTRLTQENILVFVACQPNKMVWSEKVIEMENLGESARKPHFADFIFTGSKFKSPNHCGIFKCVKNRRGEEGEKIGYIRLGNGRFRFIPESLAECIGEQGKRAYTDADIDDMIAQTQKIPQQAQAVSGRSKVINPFAI